MVYTVADILRRHHGGSVAEKPAVVDVAIFLRRSVEAVIAFFAAYFAGGQDVLISLQVVASGQAQPGRSSMATG